MVESKTFTAYGTKALDEMVNNWFRTKKPSDPESSKFKPIATSIAALEDMRGNITLFQTVLYEDGE
jgi:hypothetical protein